MHAKGSSQFGQMQQLFPYPPYKSQLELSKALYSELKCQKNKAVIVESPTGTGKTYALLVGTLYWLIKNPLATQKQHHEPQNENSHNSNQSESQSLPPWLPRAADLKANQLKEQKQQRIKQIKHISQYKKAENRQNKMIKSSQGEQMLSWDYSIMTEEDHAAYPSAKRQITQQPDKKHKHVILRIQQEEQENLPKLIFVSRTHSQLSQVMSSIAELNMGIKVVPLASKDHLCVHPKIEKTQVHEKCQHLMSQGGCPYYHQELFENFLNVTIQQAKSLGNEHRLCSYYGLKNLCKVVDVLCLPYASILNRDIRSKLGININNSIIIFDEAHNLIEQQLSMKSPEVTYGDLKSLQQRVRNYLQKYKAQMAKHNTILLQHLLKIIQKISQVLQQQFTKAHEEKISYVKLTKLDFYLRLNLVQINISEIKIYAALSNFEQKLAFFDKPHFPMSIFAGFLQFLLKLTEFEKQGTDRSGTIVLIKHLEKGVKLDSVSVKIFSMQSSELASIIHRSRAVIMAGGTMEPIHSLTTVLDNSSIPYVFNRYGHVITPEQCTVHCIEKAYKGNRAAITFTYKQMKEHSRQIIEDCHKILQTIINLTEQKSGIVVFIQSYQVLQQMAEHLGQSIHGIKLFYDSQQKDNRAFSLYQDQIKTNKSPAILVSVMGGKLSEGINFADELARSIVVFGLPYPNLKSPEIIEKMKYLDQQSKSQFMNGVEQLSERQVETGQLYYENCCLKVLNQTIGRGIRHFNDHADIYLVDSRFKTIVHKLSEWLTKNIKIHDYLNCSP